MKRAVHLCMDPGVPIYGCKGASAHVQEIVRAFEDQGLKVTQVAARLGGARPEGIKAQAVQVPVERSEEPVRRERACIAANTLVERALRDIECDLVYERYSLWSFAGADYANRCRIPLALEVNAPLVDEQRKHRSLILDRQAQDIARKVFSQADVVVAVSASVRDYVLSTSPTAHVVVIPNGVDPRRYTERGVSPENEEIVVGFLGTLKPWHGTLNLVDAFANAFACDNRLRLMIVGDGPERQMLEAHVQARRIGDVTTFTGSVDHSQVPDCLSQFDIAAAPYPVIEDFYFSPLKVVEYMAAGLPTIASGHDETRSLLGECAIFTQPGSVRDLGAAILRLASDSKLRSSLGAAARKRAQDRFTWSGVASRVLELAQGRGAVAG